MSERFHSGDLAAIRQAKKRDRADLPLIRTSKHAPRLMKWLAEEANTQGRSIPNLCLQAQSVSQDLLREALAGNAGLSLREFGELARVLGHRIEMVRLDGLVHADPPGHTLMDKDPGPHPALDAASPPAHSDPMPEAGHGTPGRVPNADTQT